MIELPSTRNTIRARLKQFASQERLRLPSPAEKKRSIACLVCLASLLSCRANQTPITAAQPHVCLSYSLFFFFFFNCDVPSVSTAAARVERETNLDPRYSLSSCLPVLPSSFCILPPRALDCISGPSRPMVAIKQGRGRFSSGASRTPKKAPGRLDSKRVRTKKEWCR